MPDSVRAILSRLEPISDRVVRRPLTEEELQALETAVGMPIPSCVRDYFSMVGLFQDLTAYGASEYEVLDRLDLFRENRKFLLKNFGAPAANLFPFAGDSAGNIITTSETTDGAMLSFADHETLKIKTIGSFCDWLSSVVEAALIKERPANTEKKWCIQFSFRVSSPDPILAVMRQFATVRLDDWSEPQISPANVHSSEAALVFGKEQLILNRSEYRTWEQPMFSFDYREPINLAASDSMIRKLDAAFREAGLAHKLIDYGPLSLDWADEELVSQPTKTRWSKFWAALTRPL